MHEIVLKKNVLLKLFSEACIRLEHNNFGCVIIFFLQFVRNWVETVHRYYIEAVAKEV